jgi:hypothetical protein
MKEMESLGKQRDQFGSSILAQNLSPSLSRHMASSRVLCGNAPRVDASGADRAYKIACTIKVAASVTPWLSASKRYSM